MKQQETLAPQHNISFQLSKFIGREKELGVVEMREGDITEARNIFTKTARAFQKDGYTIGLVVTLQYMAGLFITVGNAENAVRLIGWADTTREGIRNTRPVLEQADVNRDVAAIVARIGKDAFEEAYNKGRAMIIDEAVAYALEDNLLLNFLQR